MRNPTRVSWILTVCAAFIFGSAWAAEEYALGPGDSVKITVYNNNDLTTEARITEDGSIPFPLLGRVTVGGLTKAAAEQSISKALVERGFLRQAEVNLTVTDYRSQQVSILGEVQKPGKYPISQATNVTDILAQAGGITDKGSSTIRLVQRSPDGGAHEREIDLKQLVGVNGRTVDIAVHNGDVVYVDSQPMFYIYGEVQKPGAYPLQRDMTVRQAIATGGGLTLRGTERGLRVNRKSKSGAIESHKIKLNELLMAGDVIQVKESMF